VLAEALAEEKARRVVEARRAVARAAHEEDLAARHARTDREYSERAALERPLRALVASAQTLLDRKRFEEAIAAYRKVIT
jgi:hypothetical protein